MAVQLAKWRGAEVVATASAEDLEFVRGLSADQVIDYKAERFEDVAVRWMPCSISSAGTHRRAHGH